MPEIYIVCASAVATAFIEFHGPTGQRIEVNPTEVSSLREPFDASVKNHHWAEGTKCIMVMSNGGLIAIAEDCQTAVEKLK